MQIITPEQFRIVQDVVQQRSAAYAKKCEAAETRLKREFEAAHVPEEFLRTYPLRNAGKALLSGNVYCGHCGGRIFATTGRKSHYQTPGKKSIRIPIYKCYNRTQHKELCDGVASYRAQRVDAVVDQLVIELFRREKSIPEQELIGQELGVSMASQQQKLRCLRQELAKHRQEQDRWESLMLDSIEGTCVFTPNQIKHRLDRVENAIRETARQLQQLQESIAQTEGERERLENQHRQLLSWAELYGQCSIPEKKIILSHLIKAVTIRRGYELKVEFNFSEAQYLSGLSLDTAK